MTLFFALAAIFVATPGGAAFFDGLPFNHPAEFLLVAALLTAATVRSCRTAFFENIGGAGYRTLTALLIVGLVLKASVVGRGTYAGFLGCYGGGTGALSSCTPSFDNTFRRFGVTRIDPAIQFDSGTWRLGLLNSRVFDAIRDDSPQFLGVSAEEAQTDLHRKQSFRVPPVPFAASWRSSVLVSSEATLRLKYVGEVSVSVDGTSTAFDVNYSTAATERSIELSPGRHDLVLSYRFDPAVDRQKPEAMAALMRLDVPPSVSPGTATAVDRALGWMVDVVGFAILAGVAAASFGRRLRPVRPLLVVLAVGLLIVALPGGLWARDKLLELAAIAACLGWVSRRWPTMPAVLTLTVLCLARIAWASGPAPGVVHYRYWGDDGLTYDSFAREILERSTLRAGEDVFRGQPLFRYIRFVERVLLGEDEWLIVVAALVAFYLSYGWLTRRVVSSAPDHRVAAFGISALLLWIASGLIGFVDGGMTEYPTWILLPLSAGLLFLGRSKREYLAGAALVAVGVLVRFNQLPAYALMLAVFSLRTSPRAPGRIAVAGCLLAAVLVVCVPMLAHNLRYGGEWRVMPDSASNSINYDLPPGAWTARLLLDKVRYLLHMGTDAPTWFLPLHALQLVILGGALAVWRGWLRVFRWHGWLLAAPVASLMVHVPFAVNVYYPRHIMFSYLLAGAIVLVLIGEDGLTRLGPGAAPAVEKDGG